LDTKRARQIIQSAESIRVLHEGSEVWIEKVMDNNTAEVTNSETKKREIVPIYMLIENSSSK
jgi:small acid-soluble spore protein H (minor)